MRRALIIACAVLFGTVLFQIYAPKALYLTQAGHTWITWRADLEVMAPTLFR